MVTSYGLELCLFNLGFEVGKAYLALGLHVIRRDHRDVRVHASDRNHLLDGSAIHSNNGLVKLAGTITIMTVARLPIHTV